MLNHIDYHHIWTWSRLRFLYVLLFLLSLGMNELAQYVYRPYVYHNGIFDYNIAHTIGNHIGVLTQIFFALALLHATRIQGYIVIVAVAVINVGIEFLQMYQLINGTFDWLDIYATFIGSFIALFLFLGILLFTNKERYKLYDQQPIKEHNR